MCIISFAPNSNYRLLPGRLRITVDGLRRNPCFGEYLIQQLQNLEGIRTVTANPLSGRALIHFCPEKMRLQVIQDALERCRKQFNACYSAEVRVEEAAAAVQAETQEAFADFRDIPKAPIVATALTGGVLGAVLLKRAFVGRSPVAASSRIVNMAALVTLASGYPILKDGLEHLAKKRQINSDVLIFAITLILLMMRESITGLSVLWLVHLSHLYRHLMQARTHSAIRGMLADPTYSRIGHEEQTEKVRGKDIKLGDVLILSNGETVPVAGTVMDGCAQVSEAYISGDCITKEVYDGDQVAAGAFIVSGTLRLKAEEWGNVSQTVKIEKSTDHELVNEPMHSVSDYQANKIIPWTLGIATVVYLLARDVPRALAVLLAGCPVAVALSRQAALGSAVASAASQGIYIKDARCLELAGQADTVLFDKTGTLTTNSPEIMEVVAVNRAYSEDNILEIAASAVQSTMHPVANMLIREAARRQLMIKEAEVQHIIGQGTAASIEGMRVIAGNELLMSREGIKLSRFKARAMRMHHLGMSVLYVAVNQKVVGLIGYRDKLKPESLPAIRCLRMLGVNRIGLITGDQPYSAGDIAERLGINDQWTAVSPSDKVQIIKRLRRDNHTTLMVGDGINDAPAMAAADVGVAISCAGQNLPLRSADIVVQGNDPTNVPRLIQLSKYTGEVIQQNLCISTGFGLVGIAIAAAGMVSPAAAMLLLNFSTLAVLFNSGKVLKYRMETKRTPMDLQHFNNTGSSPAIPAPTQPQSTGMILLPDGNVEVRDTYCPAAGFHLFTAEAVCDRLKTSDLGLGNNEVLWRRSKFGLNILEEGQRPSFWELLLNQFKDFMVQVLLGAAGLSFFLGRGKDALLTLGIVAANALLGVAQERKAESSLEALLQMAAPQAKVVREGQLTKIKASGLVPGDVIELEAGDRGRQNTVELAIRSRGSISHRRDVSGEKGRFICLRQIHTPG
jgi:heavy metal translocating P-type ATPase